MPSMHNFRPYTSPQLTPEEEAEEERWLAVLDAYTFETGDCPDKLEEWCAKHPEYDTELREFTALFIQGDDEEDIEPIVELDEAGNLRWHYFIEALLDQATATAKAKAKQRRLSPN